MTNINIRNESYAYIRQQIYFTDQPIPYNN